MSKKFEIYRVMEGPIQISPSVEMKLMPEQLASRGHLVTVTEPAQRAGGSAIVRSNAILHFKKGEVIGLSEKPAANIAGKLMLEADAKAAESKDVGASDAKGKAKADADAKAAAEAAKAAEEKEWAEVWQKDQSLHATYKTAEAYVKFRRAEAEKAK